MARKRAKSMDQRSFGRSFWTVDAARAPGKLCRPPMASPEPGGMLAFAPFQGFIRGMSNKMPAKRVILELGSGNDLHGGDYTKAALRAVQDALHHSSLTMLRTPSVATTFREFEAASERMGDAAARLASGAIRREYRDHRLEWMMKSGGVQIVLDGLARNYIRFTWPLG
jgi:hypothetical protein